MLRPFALYLGMLLVLPACSFLKQSPKYAFSEGYYRTNLNNTRSKVYIAPSEDTIKIYEASSTKGSFIDTVKALKISFSNIQTTTKLSDQFFRQNTFDIDVLTIPFKYRPSVKGFPRQFNVTYNGAVYLGYRSDVYHLLYETTPLGVSRRNINHYGYSFGFFSGIGTARIDEYVTENNVGIQYDGVINLTGVALIVGINNLSVGLTGGVDFLLDQNRRYWINHKQPWIGLSFGLNLN